MIAEEYNIEFKPELSIQKGTTIAILIECFRESIDSFRHAKSQPNILKPLNENKLTQIFVEQVDIQLRKKSIAIGIKNQYSDLFFGSKGIPDFYFHALEEGRTSQPLFVFEAKRLPAPNGSVATEYVIGDKHNGGIERFKIGKHGKGFSEAGMIGYVELDSFDYWNNLANNWISDLAQTNDEWDKDEILNMITQSIDFGYLKSLVHRKNEVDLRLHHFWVN